MPQLGKLTDADTLSHNVIESDEGCDKLQKTYPVKKNDFNFLKPLYKPKKYVCEPQRAFSSLPISTSQMS